MRLDRSASSRCARPSAFATRASVMALTKRLGAMVRDGQLLVNRADEYKLEFDHGRQWATDAPLRRGMDALRAAFAGRLAAIHAGTLAPGDYAALGAKIEGEVATIGAECQLEPKADAVHVIIAELLAAADVLQGRAPGTPVAGAQRAVTALNDYGRYFDHPQWQPLQ